MGETARTIALICIFGPLAAMAFEPFFEKSFDLVGFDSEDWAKPFLGGLSVMSGFVVGNLNWMIAIMAFGLGVWVHYLALRFGSRKIGKVENSISTDEINQNYKVIPITGDLADLGLGLSGLDLRMEKHDAPNQDGVDKNWKRVCLGFTVENVSEQNITFKMRALAHDPNGWRFLDEFVFDGTLVPDEWRNFYPLEIHMRTINTPRIRYKRGDVMTELEDDESVSIVVETYSEDVEMAPQVYAIRLPVGHERFVVDFGIPEEPPVEFTELR